MTETVTIQGQGITLDLLLWRRFGVSGASLLEATFALNPAIAALGVMLPAGTPVILPDASASSSAVSEVPVDLFA